MVDTQLVHVGLILAGLVILLLGLLYCVSRIWLYRCKKKIFNNKS